jgi:hypothetical protein
MTIRFMAAANIMRIEESPRFKNGLKKIKEP